MQRSIQNGSKTPTPVSLRKEANSSPLQSDSPSQGARSRLANFSLPLNAGVILSHIRRNSVVSTESIPLAQKSSADQNEMESPVVAVTAADRKTLSPSRVQSMLQSLTRKMDKRKFDQDQKKTAELQEDVFEDSYENSTSPRGEPVLLTTSPEESKRNAGDVSTTREIHPQYPRLRATLNKADEADLQRMETGLLNLLDQFNKGELRAFVASNTLEQMKQIRDRQERLAKMHFELYNEQERLINSGDPGNQHDLAVDNLKKLTDELRDLNSSIQKLCSNEAK